MLTNIVPHNVKIIVEGVNGETRFSQRYSDFLLSPNQNINMGMYGNSLLDILIAESMVNENLTLNQILTNDTHADATRLIGSIAESLVVKVCNENPEVNRTLAKHARFGLNNHVILDNFVAVATGSLNAKNNYPIHYNPSDTQRDIIWVNKNNNDSQLLCINPKPNNGAGIAAGLQVKASHNGIKYVLPTINDYYFPVLYFDLDNDFDMVEYAVKQTHANATLLRPGLIHHELKNTLQGYFTIIKRLMNNEITIKHIIEICRYEGLTELSAGISGGGIGNGRGLILPSYLRK